MAVRGQARRDMTTPEGGAQLSVEELRTEAMRFLEAGAARKTGLDQPGWGEGSDRVSLFEERDPEQDLVELARLAPRREPRPTPEPRAEPPRSSSGFDRRIGDDE